MDFEGSRKHDLGVNFENQRETTKNQTDIYSLQKINKR
jgi:hypothetical protein